MFSHTWIGFEALSEYFVSRLGQISDFDRGGETYSVFETEHVQKETGTSMLKVLSFTFAL